MESLTQGMCMGPTRSLSCCGFVVAAASLTSGNGITLQEKKTSQTVLMPIQVVKPEVLYETCGVLRKQAMSQEVRSFSLSLFSS